MFLFSLIFLVLLLFFPAVSLAGSKYGITLWLTQLIPSLYPFFVAIRLFRTCLPGVTEKRWFLLLGLLCGYPAGADLVMKQYDKQLLSSRQAYFFLGFVNNPSPVFILTYCGEGVLNLPSTETFSIFFLLLFSSLSGSLLFLGFCSFFHLFAEKKNVIAKNSSSVSTSSQSLGKAMDSIIIDSFRILIKIGGYVVIFSIIGQFMKQILSENSLSSILCTGILEITTGISYLKSLAAPILTKKILTLLILTFGGLSAAAQTSSILTESEFSVFPYIICKAINACLSVLFGLFLFRLF